MPSFIIWLDLRSLEPMGLGVVSDTLAKVQQSLAAYGATQFSAQLPNQQSGWGAMGYRINDLQADESGFSLARDALRDFYRAIPPDTNYGFALDARDIGQGFRPFTWMKRSVDANSPLYKDAEMRRRRQEAFDSVDLSLRNAFETLDDGDVLEGSP